MRVIGVVHLKPLPGSPGYGGDMDAVLAAATADARAYSTGGADALIVENFGDIPFFGGPVPAETIAAMTAATLAVGRSVELPLGINVLRNDARAALGIAAAAGARFIRVNVHAGAMATDQGVLEGRAAETMRLRAALSHEILVLADVHVKHARPLTDESLEDAACNLHHRAHADGVIVSGSATGAATSLEDLCRVRAVLPDAKLFAGSGVTTQHVAEVLRVANGVIVGTALKRDGDIDAPVDAKRVLDFVDAANS
ncbi:MAG: BtpA/SgcQ family protein [Planctomycetota bacterium]